MALKQCPRVIDKTILMQTQPGQAIIARLPMRKRDRQDHFVESVDPTNPARQRLLANVVFHKSTLA